MSRVIRIDSESGTIEVTATISSREDLDAFGHAIFCAGEAMWPSPEEAPAAPKKTVKRTKFDNGKRKRMSGDVRRAQLLDMLKTDKIVSEIADELNVTTAYVYQVREKLRADGQLPIPKAA